jgi:nucleotide-binding universal stress UspA family protein
MLDFARLLGAFHHGLAELQGEIELAFPRGKAGFGRMGGHDSSFGMSLQAKAPAAAAIDLGQIAPAALPYIGRRIPPQGIGENMSYKRILVPVDGSPTSNAGLREAIELAKAQGASLRLVHVADEHFLASMGIEFAGNIDDLMASVAAAGRKALRAAERVVRRSGLEPSSVMFETLTGPVADPIIAEARKWRADLIVIGTHGRRGMRRVLMGSDAEQIVRLAPVPVLLVRSEPAHKRAAAPKRVAAPKREPKPGEAARRMAAIPGYQRGL